MEVARFPPYIKVQCRNLCSFIAFSLVSVLFLYKVHNHHDHRIISYSDLQIVTPPYKLDEFDLDELQVAAMSATSFPQDGSYGVANAALGV